MKLVFRNTVAYYEYKVATNKSDVTDLFQKILKRKRRGLKKSGVLSQLLINGKL